jgi:hypothetical protein
MYSTILIILCFNINYAFNSKNDFVKADFLKCEVKDTEINIKKICEQKNLGETMCYYFLKDLEKISKTQDKFNILRSSNNENEIIWMLQTKIRIFFRICAGVDKIIII